MKDQTLSLEVRGTNSAVTHECTWYADGDAPDASVELPKDGVLVVSAGSIGKFSIEGDLEFVPDVAPGSVRQLRWTSAARESGKGDGSITISHATDRFEDIEIDVEMAAEASLSVDEAEAPEPPAPPPAPLTNSDFINRYGAIGCIVLAAIGALVFALLIPSQRNELLTGAGVIGLWGYFSTEDYDRFVWRALGFVAAGFCLGFSLVMPDSSKQLMEAAGVLSFAAIWLGDH